MSSSDDRETVRKFAWRSRPCEVAIAVGGVVAVVAVAGLLLALIWSAGQTVGAEGLQGFYPRDTQFPGFGSWDDGVVTVGRAVILFGVSLQVPSWLATGLVAGAVGGAGLVMLGLLAATVFYRCPSCRAPAYHFSDDEGVFDSPDLELEPPAICGECGARLRDEQ